jgi:hypothetical protein
MTFSSKLSTFLNLAGKLSIESVRHVNKLIKQRVELIKEGKVIFTKTQSQNVRNRWIA